MQARTVRQAVAGGKPLPAELKSLAALAPLLAAMAQRQTARLQLTPEMCHAVRRGETFPLVDEFTWPSADLQLSARSPAAVARGEYEWVAAELHQGGIGFLLYSSTWCCPDPDRLAHFAGRFAAGKPFLAHSHALFNGPVHLAHEPYMKYLPAPRFVAAERGKLGPARAGGAAPAARPRGGRRDWADGRKPMSDPLAKEPEIIKYLRHNYRPAAIILHGSRAVGMSRPHSDWDIFLLFKDKPTPAFRREEIAGADVEWRAQQVPIADENLLATFSDRLQFGKVLWQQDSAGTQLLEQAAKVYAKGVQISAADRPIAP